VLHTRGVILMDGEPIGNLRIWARSTRGLAIVQEGRKVFHRLTVLDNLLLPAWHQARSQKEIDAQLKVVFQLFSVLDRKRNDPVARLSGGEQQMLAIGQGLMSFPRLLVLDEPTAGLAPIIVEQVIESIHHLSALGQSVLVLEQSLSRARRIADRSYVMRLGQMAGPIGVDELMSMGLTDFDVGPKGQTAAAPGPDS
jgi:branched-chain amino acid transport system ATP-binding protein